MPHVREDNGRGTREPLVDARDAVETLRVTLAVAEAARSGQEVSTHREDGPSAR